MRELTTPEFLETEYSILEFIDHICGDNNIPYYLANGTALGAIRHGRFIPWDCLFKSAQLKNMCALELRT